MVRTAALLSIVCCLAAALCVACNGGDIQAAASAISTSASSAKSADWLVQHIQTQGKDVKMSPEALSVMGLGDGTREIPVRQLAYDGVDGRYVVSLVRVGPESELVLHRRQGDLLIFHRCDARFDRLTSVKYPRNGQPSEVDDRAAAATDFQQQLAFWANRYGVLLDSAAASQPQGSPPSATPLGRVDVPMKYKRGTFVVPVLLNGALTLDFVVDSGASDVSIPADVIMTLTRTGTIKSSDFIGEQTYVLANGTKTKSKTLRIRTVKVGDKIVENVLASVAPANGELLLGQSFLRRFSSWSIDNTKHILILQ